MQYQEFLVGAYAEKQISINFLSQMQYGFTIKLKRLANMVTLQDNFERALLENEQKLLFTK